MSQNSTDSDRSTRRTRGKLSLRAPVAKSQLSLPQTPRLTQTTTDNLSPATPGQENNKTPVVESADQPVNSDSGKALHSLELSNNAETLNTAKSVKLQTADVTETQEGCDGSEDKTGGNSEMDCGPNSCGSSPNGSTGSEKENHRPQRKTRSSVKPETPEIQGRLEISKFLLYELYFECHHFNSIVHCFY